MTTAMQEVTSTTQDFEAPPPPCFTITLPPCRVCGERASGYHYGVNTCEACKAFFKRSLKRKSEFRCHLKGNCDIKVNRRHACPACRYKRCLDAGMSRTAIRTGRYPTEVVTSNILEVKKLRLQERITSDGNLILNRQDWVNDMQACITHLTNVHYNAHPRLSERFNTLHDREARFLEKKLLETMCFGTRSAVPAADHAEIFAQTGIDVDGRQKVFLSIIDSINTKLQAYAAFTDALPGMSQIPIDDKKAIFNASSIDRWMFLFHGWYNADHMLMSFPHDQEFVMDISEPLIFTEQVDDWRFMWGMLERLQLLELTEEEAVICSALSTVCADADVSDSTKLIIAQSIDILTSALLYLIRRNHDPHEQTFAKIVAVMTELRSLYKFYIDIHRSFVKTLPDVALPEMFWELLNVKQ